MPTGDDLIGSGMPPLLAAELGNQPSTLITAGTAQGTAAAVLTKNVTLTTAGSQTGAILPATAKIGTPYYFFNPTATSGVIYVPSGHYLNGSQNAGLTLAQNKGAILIQNSTGRWSSILTG